MSSSRLSLSSPSGLFARLAFWFVRRLFGKVPTSMRVNAHHKKILAGTLHMERAQSGARALPTPLKNLASLRVATLLGCPF